MAFFRKNPLAIEPTELRDSWPTFIRILLDAVTHLAAEELSSEAPYHILILSKRKSLISVDNQTKLGRL